jgi:hypothetical protein
MLSAEVEREALERQLDEVCAELGDDEIRELVVLARRLRDGELSAQFVGAAPYGGKEART